MYKEFLVVKMKTVIGILLGVWRRPGHLRCQGARQPGCQGARVPGGQGARVPGCQGARVPGCCNQVTSRTDITSVQPARGLNWSPDPSRGQYFPEYHLFCVWCTLEGICCNYFSRLYPDVLQLRSTSEIPLETGADWKAKCWANKRPCFC